MTVAGQRQLVEYLKPAEFIENDSSTAHITETVVLLLHTVADLQEIVEYVPQFLLLKAKVVQLNAIGAFMLQQVQVLRELHLQ